MRLTRVEARLTRNTVASGFPFLQMRGFSIGASMAEHENNSAPLKDEDVCPASTVGEGAASGNGQAPPLLVEVPDEIRPGSYRKHKRLALAGFLLVMICNGAAFGLFGSTESDFFGPTDTEQLICVIGGALGSFFVLLWCYLDALERQYSLSKTMKICLVVVAAAAFPVYAFQTRGLAGFKTLGWAILFLLLAAGAVGIGAGISKVAATTLPGRWL